jgi:hypothetical protein
MPRTGVSVLRNEPEFLDEWIAKVAEDRTRPSREERLIRRQHAANDDASAAVRARSGAAFRERSATTARMPDGAAFRDRNATTVRPPSAPRPVRAPRIADSAVRAPAAAPARPRPAARTLEDPPERRRRAAPRASRIPARPGGDVGCAARRHPGAGRGDERTRRDAGALTPLAGQRRRRLPAVDRGS